MRVKKYTRIVGVDNCFTGVIRHRCAQVEACMCMLQFMYVEITQNACAVLSCTVYIYTRTQYLIFEWQTHTFTIESE